LPLESFSLWRGLLSEVAVVALRLAGWSVPGRRLGQTTDRDEPLLDCGGIERGAGHGVTPSSSRATEVAVIGSPLFVSGAGACHLSDVTNHNQAGARMSQNSRCTLPSPVFWNTKDKANAATTKPTITLGATVVVGFDATLACASSVIATSLGPSARMSACSRLSASRRDTRCGWFDDG
jgi:hypothetical protein